MSQLDALRRDLEGCLPELEACPELLVVIPESRKEHSRIVDLLRDDEPLWPCSPTTLRFREALREEQVSREVDFLDTQEAVTIFVRHRHCQPTNPLWRRVYAEHH